jgi:hypothetical protein
MPYLFYVVRLLSQIKSPLYPINANLVSPATYFDDLNMLYRRDGLQFDSYGNPYIDDVFYIK